MRSINAGLHRSLDFVTVIGFAVAPMVFGLNGLAATVSYLLAAVHLLLTLLTRFGAGRRGMIPFKVHGVIELVVGIVLIAGPIVLGWVGAARNFYLGAGIVILLVWAFTGYDEAVATG